MELLYIFGSVIIVSLLSLIGVITLAFSESFIRRIITFLVSFAIGALYGDTFLHLLPELFEDTTNVALSSALILAGILFFLVLEKGIRWHHHHNESDEEHAHHPVGIMNLIGDGTHNFIDGLIIASSFMISIPVGIATTIAVILHEIPQEIGDFGVLLHAGFSKQNAILFNLLSAAAAVAGAIVFLTLGKYVPNIEQYIVPVTAGGFLYIAGSDLIPEIHKENDAKPAFAQILAIICGLAVMALLLLLE